MLVILAWAGLIGGLAALLAVSQSNARRDVAQRQQARVETGAEFSALYVKDIEARELRQARLWLTGRRPSSSVFARVVGDMGFTAAVLLDHDGRLLQVVPVKPALVGKVIISAYPHLAAAVAGRVAVSNVVPSAALGRPVVALAVPFSTSLGLRVFSGGFDVSQTPLGAYMSHLAVVPGHRVFLIDATETVIASSGPAPRPGETLRQVDRSLATLVATHAAGSYAAPQGRQSFFSAGVDGTPWRIVVAVPDAQLYSSLDGPAKWLTWAAVGLLALAGLVIIWLVAGLLGGRARLAVLNGELDRLARRDSLTGLRNRRDIEETLIAAFAAARRRGDGLAVLMIDIDHFKAVNDSLGHLAGDALLVKIAQTLRSSLRIGDVIGRWGGEEFIAVLPGAGAGAALDVAERIRARVETHEPDAPASATVTIGVAVWTSGGMDELITRADDALYAGKSAGRNNVHIATVEAALAAP